MTKTYYKVSSIIDNLEYKKGNWLKIVYYLILIPFFLSILAFFYYKAIGSIMLGSSLGLLCAIKQQMDLKSREVEKITKNKEKNYIAEKISDDESKFLVIAISDNTTYDHSMLTALNDELKNIGIDNKQKIEQLINEIDAKNETSKYNTKFFVDIAKGFGSIFIIAPIAFIFGSLSTETIKSLDIAKQLVESPELIIQFVQLIILIVLLILVLLFIIGVTLYGLTPFINTTLLKNASQRNKVKNYLSDIMYMNYLE
ncbi:hypothetical protein [Enterococcus sp. CWB-B31]|uniref:hypothetical protein n=1 Tax=Enterococcus sp. CWB-B31 TaxID=2885159 RepID=UPI001E602BCD|nr:hypothetical protein [Enterococcus sp. CWB-B31]MCB5955728.1 hypothetical protein [Enterococcus sp. CWB-B31]